MNDISIWFLLGTLIFPRLGLFFAWITGHIPLNPFNIWGEAIFTILFPRILICFYIIIHPEYGFNCIWIWLQMILSIVEYKIYATSNQNLNKK